jgi:hypothetical protein
MFSFFRQLILPATGSINEPRTAQISPPSQHPRGAVALDIDLKTLQIVSGIQTSLPRRRAASNRS